MNLERLDLNLLVALDVLLVEQSVTRAAGKLCISQPAMSGALMRLREHFDDPLIIRAGRTMVLTPFAADLAPSVRELLEAISEVARRRPGFDPATSDRSFTVVASDYAQSLFLPGALRRIMSCAPNVSIITELRRADHDERIARGLIDAYIVPKAMRSPAQPSQALFEDEYVVIVWRDNDVVGDALTLATYLELSHAVRGNGTPGFYGSGDEQRMRELGYQRKVVLRVPTFEMLPRAVVGTRLIATMQRRLAEIAARQHALRIFPHPLPMPRLELILQWPSLREEDPGGRWLRSILVESAQEEFGR